MQNAGLLTFLMNPKNWWLPLLIIFVISLGGVFMIGYETYNDAPPIPDFRSESNETLISHQDILDGQKVFQKYALMDYGSMFGDGASRGPDYTAEALHKVAEHMTDYYANQQDMNKQMWLGAEVLAQKEIKKNTYEPGSNTVRLSGAQEYAIQQLTLYYESVFAGKAGIDSFKPANYIKDKEEIRQLSAFFFWGAWVCGVERPGKTYSYTHNWPNDPAAGNRPSPAVILWTIIGSLGLIVGLGVVLYYHGKLDNLNDEAFTEGSPSFITHERVAAFAPTPSQRATYKFFVAALLLFFVQLLAGILTVHDFVNFTTFFGYNLQEALPITITRSWHVQLSLLWISACWIGASIFVCPFLSPAEPKNHVRWVNVMFVLILILVAGSFAGIFLGPKGLLKEWYWFGHQGWEYVELGKVWQGLLFGIFILWAIILFRALRPVISMKKPWAMPNWLIYTTSCIIALLVSGFIATPETNFVIADFWRWAVIHMWAEAFFEVFTTVLVGYFMLMMGLVSERAAIRVIYLATLLFLGSGLLGISHNFYWNAKPVGTMALGSIFSTLQVVPLILLMLEAWRFRKLRELAEVRTGENGSKRLFGLPEVFLFLLSVNFWNFLGAGVFGFIINLPFANYFEHGTYLTVNHGHAALMGVYGNLSLAGVIFCCQLMARPQAWNGRLIRVSFWCINIGLLLMVVTDLFPAGILQFSAVTDHGLWFARSAAFIESEVFQSLTWSRILGGSVFVVGGALPLVWTVVRAVGSLKPLAGMPTAEGRREERQAA